MGIHLFEHVADGSALYGETSSGYIQREEDIIMNRPFGVTLIATLAILGGIFALCGGTFGIIGSGLSGIAKIAGYQNVHPGSLFLDGIISLVLGVANIAFGVGAYLLKHWAWVLGIAIQIVTIIVKGVDFAQGHGRVLAALGIVIAAIILAYLLTTPVRRVFGQDHPQIYPTTG